MPDKFLDIANIPAISLGFYKNKLEKFEARGVADTLTLDAVDSSTLFQAASLSKVVSAAIILDLFKEKVWNLDMPICELFDYYPEALTRDPFYKKLTTRMILLQCSGLPNWFNDGDEKKFIADPGTQFTYSGLAFSILQKAIEVKTNIRWEIIAQKFFHLVGMDSSTFLQPAAVTHLVGRKVARGHDGSGRPTPMVDQNSPEIPAASLLTTAQDYIIFLRFCHADHYLNQHLFTAHTVLNATEFPELSKKIKWGEGIGIYDDGDKKIAFHWGNNPDSHAFAAIDVNTGNCVACFVNSVNGPNVFKNITHAIVDDMSPVFDWLRDCAGFKAVQPSNQEAGKDLLLFSNQLIAPPAENQLQHFLTKFRYPHS